MNQLIYFLIFIIIEQSDLTINGEDDIVCQKQTNNLKIKITCTKENELIFAYNKHRLNKILHVGENQICEIRHDKLQIDCYKFDMEIQSYKINYQNQLNQFEFQRDVEIGKNAICTQNSQKLECFGSGPIIDELPKDLLSSIIIRKLQILNDNACILYNLCVFRTINRCISQTNNNSIFCWGDTSSGINLIPDIITELELDSRQLIQKGYDTICVVNKMQINYKCWGKCIGGICDIPYKVLSNIIQFSLGQQHGCAINYTSDINLSPQQNNLSCWGSNTYGQISIPSHFHSYVSTVSAGIKITCAVKSNLHVECWGKTEEKFQQLKYNLLTIKAGGRHTCGVHRGQQDCWGNDEQGQVDLGRPNFQEVYALSAGWDFTCQYADWDMDLKCKGFNQLGQTDVKRRHDQFKGDILSLDSGLTHSCAVQKAENIGVLECWGGWDEQGQLGFEFYPDQSQDFRQVAVGHDFTCITTTTKQLIPIQCSGNNDSGQLISDQPILIGIEKIAAGGAHGCFIQINFSNKKYIQCWGSDVAGQVVIPGEILDMPVGNDVAAGDAHSCVLTKTGGLMCWGSLTVSKLLMEATVLTTDQEHICVVEEGKGRCFGGNEWGQCDAPTLSRLSLSRN